MPAPPSFATLPVSSYGGPNPARGKPPSGGAWLALAAKRTGPRLGASVTRPPRQSHTHQWKWTHLQPCKPWRTSVTDLGRLSQGFPLRSTSLAVQHELAKFPRPPRAGAASGAPPTPARPPAPPAFCGPSPASQTPLHGPERPGAVFSRQRSPPAREPLCWLGSGPRNHQDRLVKLSSTSGAGSLAALADRRQPGSPLPSGLRRCARWWAGLWVACWDSGCPRLPQI
mmetsp:Transcript_46660/g.101404  ORF Transcript_46660/g.101404 Transcript_46660/m.101404 type:complete len:227 (-) Transcript_46660:91-771(-)